MLSLNEKLGAEMLSRRLIFRDTKQASLGELLLMLLQMEFI